MMAEEKPASDGCVKNSSLNGGMTGKSFSGMVTSVLQHDALTWKQRQKVSRHLRPEIQSCSCCWVTKLIISIIWVIHLLEVFRSFQGPVTQRRKKKQLYLAESSGSLSNATFSPQATKSCFVVCTRNKYTTDYILKFVLEITILKFFAYIYICLQWHLFVLKAFYGIKTCIKHTTFDFLHFHLG